MTRNARASEEESCLKKETGDEIMSLDWLVVGTGMMGKIVAPTIRHVGDNIVGVVGRTDDHIQAFMADRNVRISSDTPYWTFENYDQALAGSGANAVAVLTPNFMHAEMGIQAAKSGKHVLMEKPLATSVEDGKAFLDAVLEAEVAAEINSQYRHHEVFDEVRRIIDGGEFEDPIFVRGRYTQDWQDKPTAGVGWRPLVRVAGYGKLVPDLGAHTIQTTLYLFGGRFTEFDGKTYNIHPVRWQPKRGVNVESFGGKEPTPEELKRDFEPMDMLDRTRYSGDDIARAEGVLMTAAGKPVFVEYFLSQVHPGNKNKFTMELVFERGRIYWDQEQPNLLVVAGPDDQERIYQRGSAGLGITGSPPGHGHGYQTSIARELMRFGDAAVLDPAGRKAYSQGNIGDALYAVELCGRWLEAPLIPLGNYRPS